VACGICKKPFSWLRWKYHCQHCGGVFCDDCTSHKLRIPKYKIFEPVKVCDGCYNVIKSSMTARRAPAMLDLKMEDPNAELNSETAVALRRAFLNAIEGGDLNMLNTLLAQVSEYGNSSSVKELLRFDKQETLLHLCARQTNGQATSMIHIILSGRICNLDDKDETGDTPLHTVVRKNPDNVSMIQYMISNGAKLNDQNNYGETVIHMIVSSRKTITEQHVSEVLQLLQIFLDSKKCDPNCRDLNGDTPLHMLARTRPCGVKQAFSESPVFKIAKMLLDSGANPFLKNHEGETPLHLASSMGHFEVVKQLVDHGAPVNDLNLDQYTPLHCAVTYGYDTLSDVISTLNKDGFVSTIEYLVAKGADASIPNKRGMSAFDLADSFEIRNILLKSEANSTDKNNPAFLKYGIADAVYFANLEGVKKYLSRGAKLGEFYDDNKTLLHVAASKAGRDLVRFIISDRALDVNAKDSLQNTALHIAIQNSNYVAAQVFLDNSAQVNMLNEDGKSAVHLLCSKKPTQETAELLQAMFRKGGNPNAMTSDFQTPLHIACSILPSVIGETMLPLHVEVLISNGADVRVVNNRGKSALHIASGMGHSKIAEVLLDKGADINQLDDASNSCLHLAVTYGGEYFNAQVVSSLNFEGVLKTIELLLKRGIKWDATNFRQKTAIELCTSERVKRVIALTVEPSSVTNQAAAPAPVVQQLDSRRRAFSAAPRTAPKPDWLRTSDLTSSSSNVESPNTILARTEDVDPFAKW